MTIGIVLLLLVAAPFVYLGVKSAMATRPANLGVQPDGKLLACPNKPNCVSTFATDKEHGIKPLTISGDPAKEWERLKSFVESMPRAIVVSDDGRYMHVEFRSFLFRFPDDVEFLLNPDGKTIDFRSASRVGYGDLGVNRSRMEAIRGAYEKSPRPN